MMTGRPSTLAPVRPAGEAHLGTQLRGRDGPPAAGTLDLAAGRHGAASEHRISARPLAGNDAGPRR